MQLAKRNPQKRGLKEKETIDKKLSVLDPRKKKSSKKRIERYCYRNYSNYSNMSFLAKRNPQKRGLKVQEFTDVDVDIRTRKKKSSKKRIERKR